MKVEGEEITDHEPHAISVRTRNTVSAIGNTLLEGVCIRLDACYEYEGFMHVYDNCHSLYYIFNANMTLFEMSLL